MTATVLRRNPVHHAGRGAVHERAAKAFHEHT